MSRLTRDICDALGIKASERRPSGPESAQMGELTAGPGNAVSPAASPEQEPALPALGTASRRRLVLAGGSGFLGGLLTKHFTRRGWNVVVLTRAKAGVAGRTVQVRRGDGPASASRRPETGVAYVSCLAWDGRTLGDWTRALEAADAVINLAGRSVNCRYHARNRRLMMDSRVEATRVLGEAIARCAAPPPVWLNLSTATIYKHTFGPAWDEQGTIGATPEDKDAFSIDVATAWEGAFNRAIVPRTRQVALRSAMVFGLSADANNVYRALRRLVRLALGGRMGTGRQWVSWIHEADFCRAVEFLIEREDLSGPVNLAAPTPVPNADLMRILRRVLGRPIGLPAARWMLEVGAFLLRTETELIIKSRRVVPGRLREAGFRFEFERLEDAICDLEQRLSRPLEERG